MSELIVIYDPEQQVAALVDTENRIGYGPAAIGPDAQNVLETFLATIPYDISEMSSYGLRSWFEQFVPAFRPAGGDQQPAGVDDPVEPATPAADPAAALAQREAAAAGDGPPAPQPADTDSPQNEGETAAAVNPPAYEGPCYVCSGTGAVPGADEGTTVRCNFCQGTGQLPAPQAA